jgi:uncharacterized protein
MGSGSLQGKTYKNILCSETRLILSAQPILLKPSPTVSEHDVTDPDTGHSYIALRYEGSPYQLQVSTPNPGHEVDAVSIVPMSNVSSVHFVPYFFRGNRGGKGQMRVGLRRKK